MVERSGASGTGCEEHRDQLAVSVVGGEVQRRPTKVLQVSIPNAVPWSCGVVGSSEPRVPVGGLLVDVGASRGSAELSLPQGGPFISHHDFSVERK